MNKYFTIDNIVSYEINIYEGGITNDGIIIFAYEELNIEITKNDISFDYSFGETINEDGYYIFKITDTLGNYEISYFTIITKKKQELKHILKENIEVESVIKDRENYEFQILEDDTLYLFEEGKYTVNISDKNSDKNYTFDLEIDTTPPTLILVNVENGGKTSRDVILRNISESNCTLLITCDNTPFEYTLGEKIEKAGEFVIILTDEAGNKTTYTFTKTFALNVQATIVLGSLGAIVVVIIACFVKSRKHYEGEEISVIEEINTDVKIE